jgi:high affinity sulfate transporter 1
LQNYPPWNILLQSRSTTEFQELSSTPSTLRRIAPGIAALVAYDRKNFSHDLLAGLSVAAVAVPVGVAYAQLAGFNPAVGLYSSILPLVAYAIFGTSRQLIIGPDSGTCALVAAAVAPLAAGNADLYLSLSIALAILTGLLCIAGSFLKLGALADFLSKPILVGFLNGIALSIMLGQIGKIFGFPINSGGIIPRVLELVSKLRLTHIQTLAVGVGSFLVLLLAEKYLPRLPSALVAMVVAALAVKFLGLGALGVKTVGTVPGGWPHPRLPMIPMDRLADLLAEAAGVALVSFSSLMPPARSFAAKNGYDMEVDGDRELAALGFANLASAFSQGFAVSAADSRTAVGDAAGSKTQMTGLVAAMAIAAVLLFFTSPLQFVPTAALGAVLVKAAMSLVDVKTMKALYRIDLREFGISLLATMGVVAVGAIQAILVAVMLAIVRFVRLVSRPQVEILGVVEGLEGFHGVDRHEKAATIPGLLLFRFDAPIVFFNAPFFKQAALAAADAAGPGLKWFVMDMIPVTMIDATGLYTVDEVISALRARGTMFVAAGRLTEWKLWFHKHQVEMEVLHVQRFPTIDAAVRSFREG